MSLKKENNTLDTTMDDWRAELERMVAGDPGMTVRELCKETGIKRTAMQTSLNKLIASGRCFRGIGKRLGAGGVYTVSVYQLIPKKEENDTRKNTL